MGEKDKYLLKLEWVIARISIIAFFTLIFIASYIEMEAYIRVAIIVIASVIFAIGIGHCIKIEQIAGFYKCDRCGHKYIPTYKSVFFAMHFGRTRFMKCPKCNKKSWNKKVLK